MRTASSPPALSGLHVATTDGRGTRHATWLELFFDLVYVVAVTNLNGVLLRDSSPAGVLAFLALFVPVWWAWIGISYFVDQFALPERAERVLMFQQIALSLGLAVGLPGVVAGDVGLFGWCYVGLRTTLAGLYTWAARAVPEGRELCAKYAAVFWVGTALWVVSLALPPAGRVAVWGVALALEIAGTIWAYVSTPDIPAQVSHMDERFGLFTLIVLGESVLAVATGGSHVEGPAGWVVALCGIALACGLWWLYFASAAEDMIDRALRSGRRALYLSFAYGYTHLLLFAGVVATSVGIEHAFEDVTHAAVSEATRLTLCGGLAVYVFALAVVQRAQGRQLPRRAVIGRVAVALGIALLGVLGQALPPVIFPLLAAVAVALLIAVERGEDAS